MGKLFLLHSELQRFSLVFQAECLHLSLGLLSGQFFLLPFHFLFSLPLQFILILLFLQSDILLELIDLDRHGPHLRRIAQVRSFDFLLSQHLVGDGLKFELLHDVGLFSSVEQRDQLTADSMSHLCHVGRIYFHLLDLLWHQTGRGAFQIK